jgi:hypothetical protein
MSQIPAEVTRFILDHVGSVDQLEILLTLAAEPERSWTPPEVARELRIDAEVARRRMQEFVGQSLLTSRTGEEFSIGEAPGLRKLLSEVASSYASMRVSVIQTIYSRPAENIQLFAAAFRLRKRDEDPS